VSAAENVAPDESVANPTKASELSSQQIGKDAASPSQIQHQAAADDIATVSEQKDPAGDVSTTTVSAPESEQVKSGAGHAAEPPAKTDSVEQSQNVLSESKSNIDDAKASNADVESTGAQSTQVTPGHTVGGELETERVAVTPTSGEATQKTVQEEESRVEANDENEMQVDS
jgi:hypothetical protein